MGKMTVIRADVCIVGAGPGGALLAYLLAKANISTVLLERHHDINKEFRGEHLNEEGEAVLEKAELFSKLEKVGLLYMDKVEYVMDGKVMKTIIPSDKTNHVGIHVPQKNLLTLLLNEALLFPSLRVMMNSRVINLIQDSTGKAEGVTAVIDGKELVIKSKIIVGADGRNSTIRKIANFPYTPIRHGYDLLWARIPAPNNWEPTIKMALANDSQLALFTQFGGYIQIGWNIEENSFPQIRKRSFDHYINCLVRAFPELEDTVKKSITSWKDFVLLKVESSKSDTWIKNNVVLIGDAAHTMSPTGAFGLNSSLKDAEVLANVLEKALKESKGSYILSEYESMRRDAVENIQQEQLNREASFKQHFSVNR